MLLLESSFEDQDMSIAQSLSLAIRLCRKVRLIVEKIYVLIRLQRVSEVPHFFVLFEFLYANVCTINSSIIYIFYLFLFLVFVF